MVVSDAPKVAVVLPIFNGEAHLRASIDSILAQTFVDFELVLVDDASTDNSLTIARGYEDSRIRVLALQENRGLAAALNDGIGFARAPIIARQDQDDISAPQRLERQLAVLEQDAGVVLVGTWAKVIRPDGSGGWQHCGAHHHPVSDDALRLRLLWNNPFVHSSVVFQRSAFEEAGQYGTDPELNWPEDYDLWVRMAPLGRMATVPDELVIYRQTHGGMSDINRERILHGVVRIATRNLAKASGCAPTDTRVKALARVLNSVPTPTTTPVEALQRARIFLRACRMSVHSRSLALSAMRARWAGKIVARSLDPRWGSIDNE
ncbi:MAG: glycosyltransferase [Candidatus Nanopelagicales bacterium]|nr:glycosyltransferase [Candidatus Nanopelagicales bacterium]